MENISAYLPSEEKDVMNKADLSLGTVATRSTISQQLVTYQFIEVKKNNIHVLSKGFLLIDALGKERWIASPRTTGLMEQYLEEVKKGKKSATPFINRTKLLVTEMNEYLKAHSEQWQFDSSLTNEVLTKEQKKPAKKYGSGEVIGKCLICYGDIQDRGTFYGCSNYKEKNCKFSFKKKISGQSINIL